MTCALLNFIIISTKFHIISVRSRTPSPPWSQLHKKLLSRTRKTRSTVEQTALGVFTVLHEEHILAFLMATHPRLGSNEEYKKILKDVVEHTTPIINALNELPVYYRYHFKKD